MQIENVEKVFDTLKAFINKKPNLDPRDYYSDYKDSNGRRAYYSELRSIQKDGTRARKALREALSYPADSVKLAESFERAFSGRLSWTGKGLEYCTGQYFPTEYRKAAATVLETYCHAVKPRFTPAQGILYTHIEQIEKASDDAGSHSFDKSTKRFFRSRVLSYVFHGAGGVFFISSEQYQGSSGTAPRMFTIRQFNPETADISAFGPFNELTREKAIRLARIASEYPLAALEALGYTLDKHGYQVKVSAVKA